MGWLVSAVLALLMGLAVSVGAGQGSGLAVAADEPAASQGSIAGRVTEAGDASRGLSEVTIRVVGPGGSWDGFGQTDAQGRYLIEGLAPGFYRVLFVPADQRYLGAYHPGDVVVDAGRTTADVDGALALGGRIEGRVTAAGPDGAPLGNIAVRVVGQDGIDVASVATRTAHDGTYAVTRLPAGVYRLHFDGARDNRVPTHYRDAQRLADATALDVRAGQTITGIDQSLAVGGQITGRITRAAAPATPIASADVRVFDADGVQVARSATDGDGRYRAVGLPTGSYRVAVHALEQNYVSGYHRDGTGLHDATPVPVTAGQVTEGIDQGLVVGGRITGRVSFDEDIDWVRIEALDAAGDTAAFGFSGPDGAYVVEALPTGEYRLRFVGIRGGEVMRIAYHHGATDLDAATPVAVTAGQTTEVVAQSLPAVAPAAPAMVRAPRVVGVARQGQTLWVDTGEWSGGPITVTWVWLRCRPWPGHCEIPEGAEEPQYLLGESDVGARIRALVFVSGPGGRAWPYQPESETVLPATPDPSVPGPAVAPAGGPAAGTGAGPQVPAPGSSPDPPPPATVPAPPVPARPAAPVRLRLAAPSVGSLRVGKRVRLTVAARVPVAGKGRPAVVQYRIGKRWVRAARLRAPAHGRLRLRLLVAVPAVRAGARVPARVRVHLPAHRGRPAVTGPARQFRLPAAPRVGAAR